VRRLVAAVLLTAAACRATPSAAPASSLEPGRIVPGSVGVLRSSLAAMMGRPVVVNYWATWCIPCRAEMPRIAAAATRYGSSVHFVGVDVEDDTGAAEAFAAQRGVKYPMLSDPHGAIRGSERILGLPVTQFYRADGQLAFVNNGEISSDELKMRIDQLLAVGTPARD
jgi:thiol-disulfide isomerase/thioredoxin